MVTWVEFYKKLKNKGDEENGENRKETPGKMVEVVWACDAKKGALRRKEGNGNESRAYKGERRKA